MKYLKILGVMLMLTVLSALEMSCGGTNATSMRLVKTEGTVEVADGQGSAVPIKEKLGLYSGYQVETDKESYAWIDLDSTKLTKLDVESEAQVQKDEDQLELIVNKGNIFFNVTQPLSGDETLNIRSSTMMVGIRGTCGWVSVRDQTYMRVYILEGTVECGVTSPESGEVVTASVSSGEMAVLTFMDGKGDITVSRFDPSAIPGFVLDEMEDDSLNERVADSFGTDIQQWVQSVVTVTMPVTDLEIIDLLHTDGVDTVIVRPDGENSTLIVEHDYEESINIDEGQSLILEEGMSMEVTGRISIWGTLRIYGDFTVNGGSVTNAGIMEVAGSAEILPSPDNGGWMQMVNGSYTKVEQGLVSQTSLWLVENSEFVGDMTVYNTGNINFMGRITGNLALYATEERAAISVGMEGTVIGTVTLESGNQALGAGNYDSVVINGGNLYINAPGFDTSNISINQLTVNGGTAHIRQLPHISIGSVTNNGGEVIYKED